LTWHGRRDRDNAFTRPISIAKLHGQDAHATWHGDSYRVKIDFQKHRVILIVVALLVVSGLAFAPFMSASCRTQRRPDEKHALEQLRLMTRNEVIPADSVLLAFERDYPNSRVAALARLTRARGRLKANDFAGAAELLSSDSILEKSGIVDYALFMRARALDQGGRTVQARADYERIAQEYPRSLRAREALLLDATILQTTGQAGAVPGILKKLDEANDGAALLKTARSYDSTGNSGKALAAYRQLYFFAPTSSEASDAAQGIVRLGSQSSPGSAEEALARANGLFKARRFSEAAIAYADAVSRFSTATSPELQLRRGIAAANSKQTADAVSALMSVPASSGETRAEALYYLAQTYAVTRQWTQVRSVLDELRRSYPRSGWSPRAFVNAGNIARNAKNDSEASFLFNAAIAAFPATAEVAQAQFDLAWLAHQSRDFQQSSRLLIEHLALYADKNTDNRGRAGYWAARDSERAGKIKAAKALYEAMQARYDANWYGYLAKQRLTSLGGRPRSAGDRTDAGDDPMVAKAVANLKTVTVADDDRTNAHDEQIAKAYGLTTIGADDWALEELDKAGENDPTNPQVNLAAARIYRSRDDNVMALNVLKRTYPDYSQMKPEELTREEWDVFYPLAYWNSIKEESKARNLDPHQVAGLIRQESVFNPRAKSGANAFGLMQLLVSTARLTAQKYGVNSTVTADSLYEPKLNIRLGTAYLRDQLDKFGRIEYVAAAYNAGPNRVVQWRASLPLELDEWAEAIPFKETRGYVQGVVRNTMQYAKLYDSDGSFRPGVGSRAVNPSVSENGGQPSFGATGEDPTIIRKRTVANEEE
jgi:soluble lytic murein transglycosylase